MPAPVAAVAPTPVAAPKTAPTPANGVSKGVPQSPVKPAPAPGAQAEGVSAEQTYKIKVDGQVVEMTIAEMERYASKGRYADKATQEAKEAIKRAKQAAADYEAREKARIEKAKTDTDAWLKEHGIDPLEYAKSKLQQKVEEGKMTPEQKRAAELEMENKRLKQAQEEAALQAKKQQAEQLQQHLQKRIETELVNAAKRAGMSLGDDAFYAIYKSFEDAFELGLLPLDAQGLTPHMADRIVEDAMGRIEGEQKNTRTQVLKLKGQALEDFLGKEAADHIVSNRLELIRAAKGLPAGRPGAPAPTQTPAKTPAKYLSPAEADEQLKRLGGR